MSHASKLPAPNYETREGSPRSVVFAGFGLIAGILLVLAASLAIYRGHYGSALRTLPTADDRSFTHGPAARTPVERDRATQDALARERLTTYAWVDRTNGVIRIPIERAIDLVSAESTLAPAERRKP